MSLRDSQTGDAQENETSTAQSERVPTQVYASAEDAGRAVAAEIAALIRDKASRGEKAVLGLATGSTPKDVYHELVRLHREEGLSFRNVVSFNLDEWWPMQPGDLQSYHRFMHEYLFEHVDVLPENVHVPDGTVDRDQAAEFCEQYERQIRETGGIDYQILGIGRTGHIGFNEPGSRRDSRTRMMTIDKITRMDAASDFFGVWHVPHKAITMGVGTILDARRVVLMAFGEGKANIVREAVEGPITNTVAASFLQEHPDARFVLDPAAAAALTRVRTPWMLGPLAGFGMQWDEATTRRAVVWLAREVNKPILKLTDEDYNEHGLQELLGTRGRSYETNIHVFKSLQHTITGWPGGKAGRPRLDGTADVFPKRIVVFSPHPDDDVISMGGTLIRLCEQGHEVHVAYQTSGNIAVFDDEAVRHADFVSEFCRCFKIEAGEQFAEELEQRALRIAHSKRAGEADPADLQLVKALIRRTEARAAARYSGVMAECIHFLDLPFYETGRVKKRLLSAEDVAIVQALLEQVKPHQVYAAGDLSDPHGTHRVCLNAVITALQTAKGEAWAKDCELWLYRGAWQEWEPHEIERAVPLSPDEVERKRMAIFKHQSQKDKALFPGPWDEREFWQRAEARNHKTAVLFDQLGLPEYEAIEAFVRSRWGESRVANSE